MSGQVNHGLIYLGKKYDIIDAKGSLRINPMDYNIWPSMTCTACWDGYWCDYKVDINELFFENLYINAFDKKYPKINGVHADFNENEHMGHHFYQGLHIKKEYTGEMLIGSDFIHSYYHHSGYQDFWAYKTLIRLVFDNGILTETCDLSNEAENIRETKGPGYMSLK